VTEPSRPIASALALRVGALLLLLAPAPPGLADEEDGRGVAPYLEISGGSTRSLDQDAKIVGTAPSATGDVDYDAGWQTGAAVGVRVRQLRAEVDVRYRDAGVESLTLQDVKIRTSGETKVLSGLANLYLDIDLGWPITPFLGGGIGAARLDFDAFRRGVFSSDDDATEFAWNVMAGLGIAIAQPLDLFFRYRHFATTEATFDAVFPDSGDRGDLTVDFSANEFEMGVRYTF